MTDWDAIDEQFKPKFKEYAKAGTYKVKLAEVEIHEVGSKGSIAQDFKFEEDDHAYPKATHWLSFKNDGWRKYHNKQLMMLLGATEEAAKKAVDACEKDDKEKTVKAYTEAYNRLAQKHPEVEIEVWMDGKYGRADFTDGTVRMGRPDDSLSSSSSTDDDPLDGATEEKIDADSLPF